MKTPRKAINVRSVVAISLVVAVLAVVIVGVTLLDSPAQERLRRLDERRVSPPVFAGRACERARCLPGAVRS